MTELQKEYCEEKGLIYIKPQNTEIADYVSWLEAQIQALRIHSVSQQSELLIAFFDYLDDLPMGLQHYDRENIVGAFKSNL